MIQRPLHPAALLIALALMPAPETRASGFVTSGPPAQRLWIRDALTGAGIPKARVVAVGAAPGLTIDAWSDPSGRLRLFPFARTGRIEILATGYRAATITPAPVPGQTTTVWLMPNHWPRALRPDVIAARRFPGAALLHGHVVSVSTGRPVPGASVRLAGTAAGVFTDSEGYFLLYARAATAGAAPERADLIVSAPGYISVRLARIALIEGDFHSIVDLERGVGEKVWNPRSGPGGPDLR